MSGKKTKAMKAAAKPKPKLDRRAWRTRNALGDALIELMQERPFKSVTVQDVLDRAKVGRSTFYEHYRDKNDLLLSDVEDFWEMMSSMIERRGEDSKRVAAVRELFSHLAEVKNLREAMIASGKAHDVMELGQGHFARSIEKRLMKLCAAREPKAGQFTAMAHAFAGALFASLNWWIDRGMPVPPAEMDDQFHQLVWAGVNGLTKENSIKETKAKPARTASH